MKIIDAEPWLFRYAETTTRSGIVGITRKTLIATLTTSSTQPPEYAPSTPSVAASAVAIAAAASPRNSDVRAPQTTCEKMSFPWSVVPKKWCHDGLCLASSSEYAFGSWVAIQGAKIATTTIAVITIRPKRDFGFASSSRSHSGIPNRPRRSPREGSGTSTGTSCSPGTRSSAATGWICDIG